MTRWIAHHAEVLDALGRMETNSVDGILSDFPYGLGNKQPTLDEILRYLGGEQFDTGGDFMGADWHIPSVPTWREMHRVLKPGGYLLGFGAPRTIDLISLGARAGGFEVRDVITFAWVFGSGFPKSQNASLAIDKAAGAEREVVGKRVLTGNAAVSTKDKGGTYGVQVGTAPAKEIDVTAPATELAGDWQGFGTALKPAFEPILLARKPLIGTLTANIEEHGTGALAIDASRIATDWSERSEAWKRSGHSAKPDAEKIAAPPGTGIDCHPAGRWPANFALDEAAAALLDVETGALQTHGGTVRVHHTAMGYGGGNGSSRPVIADEGGPSRFFYVAKASREERELGCEGLPFRTAGETTQREDGSAGLSSPRAGAGRTSGARNYHPNVKPIDLVRYLAGLIKPPARRDGVPRRIVIPYAGSGSEMIGAILAGWDLVEGIEREPRKPGDPDYQAILRARVSLAATNPRAFEPNAVRKTDKPLDGQRSLFGDLR